MLIRYDNEVLAIARRIAASRTAKRADVLKLLTLNQHVPRVKKSKNMENMPYSNYLGKEARAILFSIANRIERK